MKKIYLILSVLLFTTQAFTQIDFEKGYYVNNKGERIEGFIKNQDWKNNPTKFQFKADVNQIKENTLSIDEVAEFVISDVSKYVRQDIKIDRSSSLLSKIGTSIEPDFRDEVLFLRVLIEGEKSLAIYEEGSLNRFFYKDLNSKYEPLVFKKYLTEDDKLAENSKFRQQLWVALRSLCIDENMLNNLPYNRTTLKNLFIKYYDCNGQSYTQYNAKKRDVINLSLRLGLNSSKLYLNNAVNQALEINVGNALSLRAGVELELVLPFNKNKWAIIFEPTFQYYKTNGATTPNSITGRRIYVEASYNSIETPLGLRHFFFLSNTSKIYINGLYYFDFPFNSLIEYYSEEGNRLTSLDLETLNNFALGIGYEYKNKIGLEIRYLSGRELLNKNLWESNYNTLSFIIGYSLF